MSGKRSATAGLRNGVFAAGLVFALAGCFTQAMAQVYAYDIPAEPLAAALRDYARVSGQQIIFTDDLVAGHTGKALHGNYSPGEALAKLLAGTDLIVERSALGSLMIRRERHADRDAPAPGTRFASLDNAVSPVDPADDPAADAAAAVETVVVTGSRIVRNGNEAPTPVTVLSSDELQNLSPSTVPDALVKLPQLFACAFSCSNTAAQNNQGGGLSGGTFLNLNNLGANRVLILQDGHRVAPTNNNNTVDVQTLPSQFVERVDIVTGGASAVYGSDAVAGVVNYVTNTHFNGLKGQFQGGISDHGDGRDLRMALAGGTDLFGGRGHVEASIDFFHRDEIPTRFSRPYGATSPQFAGNGSAANPYVLVQNARQSNVSYGGLITTGPLAGQMFQPDGSLTNFNPGIPTKTANLAIGGDGATQGDETLIPSEQYHQEFARLDYDLSPTTHWYLQASYGEERSHTRPQNQVFTDTSYPITIYSGNAYLTPAQQAAAFANPATLSFNLNRYMQDVGGAINFVAHVRNAQVNTGVSGSLFGDWKWDAYYTHGQGYTANISNKNIDTARFYAAIDAVKAPAGNTLGIPAGTAVCRATLVTPGLFPGCQPMDLFGDGAPSQASRNYVWATTYYQIENTLDDFAGNLTGTLFDGWAGPIKFATGVEYRIQSLNETVNVPGGPVNPTGLRGANPTAANPNGSFPIGTLNYTKNVVGPAHGANSVYEGNVEVNVPLLANIPGIQALSVDGAYRYTDYSTSGSANTWRVGLDWQVFSDLRLRATRSRDIRAPTLFDLFQGQSTQITGFTDVQYNSGGTVNLTTQGNSNLKPEVAQNTTAGAVYTPSWLQGFSLSADFFRTYIGNAIGNVSGANASVQAICVNSGGSSPLCSLIQRATPTSFPYNVLSYNANIGVVYTEGYNFEMDYTLDLSSLSDALAGNLTNRVFWTRQPMYKSQSLPGTPFTDASATKSLPKDRITWNVDYRLDAADIGATIRYFDPVANVRQAGVFYAGPGARIGSYTQIDLNASYDFQVEGAPFTAFLNINNLLANPGPYAMPIGPSLNPGFFYPTTFYADPIGRYYTVGTRIRL